MAVLQIFLQYCYSTILNIELHCSQYCKKKKNLLLLFPPKFLSHPSHFFCSLLSLPSLFLHLLSPLYSFITEISHLSHTASLSSLIAWPLFHCIGAGFWIFEVGGWIGELGLDCWAGIGWWWVWIGWSVGLKWWICWSVGGSFGLIIDSSGDDF